MEVPPELIGGLEGLSGVVQYPDYARRAGIEGTVLLQFIVNETGAVDCAEALVSPSLGLGLEAIRALATRQFRPGTQEGVPVRVRYTLPVVFRLR